MPVRVFTGPWIGHDYPHDLGIDIVLEKISGPGRIAAYRALSVPAVAVDGKLVSSGGVPGRKAVEAWLSQGWMKRKTAP